MEFLEEGLVMTSIDPSHVCMLDIRYPNTMFEKYNAGSGSKFTVKADKLKKIIAEFGTMDQITIHTIPDEQKIKLSSKDLTYEVKIIDEVKNNPKLPRIPIDTEFEISDIIKTKKLIKKGKTFGEYMTLSTSGFNDDHITIEIKNNEGELMNVNLPATKEIIKEESKTQYSLEYLHPIISKIDPRNDLSMGYSTDKPLKVTVKVSNVGYIDFYLAPRIES